MVRTAASCLQSDTAWREANVGNLNGNSIRENPCNRWFLCMGFFAGVLSFEKWTNARFALRLEVGVTWLPSILIAVWDLSLWELETTGNNPGHRDVLI